MHTGPAQARPSRGDAALHASPLAGVHDRADMGRAREHVQGQRRTGEGNCLQAAGRAQGPQTASELRAHPPSATGEVHRHAVIVGQALWLPDASPWARPCVAGGQVLALLLTRKCMVRRRAGAPQKPPCWAEGLSGVVHDGGRASSWGPSQERMSLRPALQ